MLLSRLASLSLDHERLVWLAGSLMLYIAVTNALWALSDVSKRIRWTAGATVVAGVLRFVFYAGVPYVALLGGLVTLESLGAVPAPSPESLNLGALVAAGGVVLAGLMAWHYGREVSVLYDGDTVFLASVRQTLSRPWGWVLVLLTVVYQQIHWAFYRALPALVLDDLYVGGFTGLALVLLEAYANPHIRRDLTSPARAEFLLLSAGFAVWSTLLFVLTETSWLGAAVHLVAILGWMLLRGRKSE